MGKVSQKAFTPKLESNVVNIIPSFLRLTQKTRVGKKCSLDVQHGKSCSDIFDALLPCKNGARQKNINDKPDIKMPIEKVHSPI